MTTKNVGFLAQVSSKQDNLLFVLLSLLSTKFCLVSVLVKWLLNSKTQDWLQRTLVFLSQATSGGDNSLFALFSVLSTNLSCFFAVNLISQPQNTRLATRNVGFLAQATSKPDNLLSLSCRCYPQLCLVSLLVIRLLNSKNTKLATKNVGFLAHKQQVDATSVETAVSVVCRFRYTVDKS